LDDEKKGRELVDRKRSDLEAELAEVREDFEEALSARKTIGDQKTKLQAEYEELKKTAEADAGGNLSELVRNRGQKLTAIYSPSKGTRASEEFGAADCRLAVSYSRCGSCCRED
jgi:hypothetical protein